MIKLLQDVNLCDKGLQVLYLLLLDRLDCKLFLRLSVFCQVNQAKTSSGQLLDEVVLVFNIGFKATLDL